MAAMGARDSAGKSPHGFSDLYRRHLSGVASAQLISLWVTQFVDPTHYGQYALALAVSNPLLA